LSTGLFTSNQTAQKAAVMRPARALIDLQALRHNYQLARELTGAKALAVIKADAYGHGAVRCALALEQQADGFAVACIEEALELRAAGIKAPVLLLEGFFEASELPLIVQHDLWCVVHSLWQLEAIEQAQLSKPITVWLKLDSGMHRVGLHAKDYQAAYQRLLASGKVARIVLMSHFARADELDSAASNEQLAVFQSARLAEHAQRLGASRSDVVRRHAVRSATGRGRPAAAGDDRAIAGNQRA
jgi:alanine racemase